MLVKLFVPMIFVLSAATGCASSSSEANVTDNSGDKEMTTTVSNEIFPERNFSPIQFKPTKRAQPKSIEEATASLEAIKNLYDWQNIPAALNQDLSFEKVRQYVEAWKLIGDQMPHDIEWLKKLDVKNIPGGENLAIQKAEGLKKNQLDWLENRLPSQMENSAKYTRQFLEGCVAPMMWNHIEKAADCDMSDSSKVANLLARPEQNENRAKQIKQVATAYEALRFFDAEMGIDSDWDTKKKAFRKMVVRYQNKLEQAGDAIKPPSDIGNGELTKIAEEVLTRKTYKLPKSVRVIVNAPKKSYGKDHYTIDFGERSIEKSPYRWEEFQVATIELEGDQHYLWYNTILNYSEGPHTVPTGKWVLGPRHKSGPISMANIDK